MGASNKIIIPTIQIQLPLLNLFSTSGNPLGTTSSLTSALITSTYLIPAGTLGPKDCLIIESAGAHSNGSDTYTKTVELRIGTNSNGIGNSVIYSMPIAATAGNISWYLPIFLRNKGVVSAQRMHNTSIGSGTLGPQVINFAVDNYVALSGLVSNAAGTVNCEEMLIQVQRGI